MPVTPVLWRYRQADFYELEDSLLYRVSSRRVMSIVQRNHFSKTKQK